MAQIKSGLSTQRITVKNFGGILTAIDSSNFGFNGASDCVNYSILNGKLVARPGTSSILANISGNTGVRGFGYFRGYDSGSNFYEKYLYIHRTASAMSAKLVDPTSYATTNLTFSPAISTNLDSTFSGINYDTYTILTNGIKTYSLLWGATTINEVGNYTVPSGTIYVDYNTDGNKLEPLTGLASTLTGSDYVINSGTPQFNNTYKGSAFNAGHFYIRNKTAIQFNSPNYRTNNLTLGTDSGDLKIELIYAKFDASVYADLKNMQYRDRAAIEIQVTKGNAVTFSGPDEYKTWFDTNKFKITLIDVNSVEINPEWVLVKRYNGTSNDRYSIQYGWDNKDRTTTRFDWTQVERLRIETYVNFPARVSSWGAINIAACFELRPLRLDGVDLTTTPADSLGNKAIKFGIARYNASTLSLTPVTSIVSFANNLRIEGDPLNGDPYFKPTGSWLTVTFPRDNDSSATSTRLYAQDSLGKWRQLTSQANSTTTSVAYSYKYSANDLNGLTQHVGTVDSLDNCNCLTTHRGWVVYGINRSTANVRHAKIGYPFYLYDINDESEAAGADYTLSESYSDVPIAMASVNSTLLIFGNEGVYAQTGERPGAMTPTQKIPNIAGIANKYAFCRYNDPVLGQGAVYVTKDGSKAFFVYADARQTPVAYRTIELTEGIRPSFKTILTDGNSGGLSGIRVTYLQDTDQIWISSGRNVWVWEKPDIISGKRNVVRFLTSNSDATFNYITNDVLTDGTVKTAFAPAGTAITLGKIDSSVYTDFGTSISLSYTSGDNYTPKSCRVADVFVDKVTKTNSIDIYFVTTRQTSETKTYGSNVSNNRFGPKNQGFKQRFNISETASANSGVTSLLIDLSVAMQDRQSRNIL